MQLWYPTVQEVLNIFVGHRVIPIHVLVLQHILCHGGPHIVVTVPDGDQEPSVNNLMVLWSLGSLSRKVVICRRLWTYQLCLSCSEDMPKVQSGSR